MFRVFLAIVLSVLTLMLPSGIGEGSRRREFGGFGRRIIQGVLIFFAFLTLLSTSFTIVGSNEVGHLSRVYLGRQLPPGRVIALAGENGPQAEILGPGFHFRFLLNVLYKVTIEEEVVEIKAGKLGKLIARDGQALKPGQMFAEVFGDGNINSMLDVTYFLTNGGQKGPQIFVLTPGKWRINKFQWDVVEGGDTSIEKGFVGVVKSNVRSGVSFGDMSIEKPKSCSPTIENDLSGGKLSVPLVPVGCIGIWDRTLLPGRYYVNDDAYAIFLMDTRVRSWEFKGGFSRRTVALHVDQDGKITQKDDEIPEPVKEEYADRAVFLKVEGWDIPQELRVLVQITPENAPIVVASVGGEKEVEHRIIVPAVRSIIRDVTGGGFIEVEGLNDKGEVVKTKRPPRVLDLLDNRAVLEKKALDTLKPEGSKAGVEIKEVRFGDPAVPPELLVARLREQLAQQLSASYRQERVAQDERVKTENARATANQQDNLVQAQIEFLRQQELKKAAQLAGEGEKLKLMEIATGQKSQVAVLGEERVVALRKYELLIERIFNAIEKHPELLTAALSNVGKLVPQTVIQTSGTGSLDGPAAILGSFLGQQQVKQTETK